MSHPISTMPCSDPRRIVSSSCRSPMSTADVVEDLSRVARTCDAQPARNEANPIGGPCVASADHHDPIRLERDVGEPQVAVEQGRTGPPSERFREDLRVFVDGEDEVGDVGRGDVREALPPRGGSDRATGPRVRGALPERCSVRPRSPVWPRGRASRRSISRRAWSRRTPLEESAREPLIRALAASGDRAAAARQVAAWVELFRRELGVEPGPAVYAAAEATGVTATVTRRLGPGGGPGAARRRGGRDRRRRARRGTRVPAPRGGPRRTPCGDLELKARSLLALGSALAHAARGPGRKKPPPRSTRPSRSRGGPAGRTWRGRRIGNSRGSRSSRARYPASARADRGGPSQRGRPSVPPSGPGGLRLPGGAVRRSARGSWAMPPATRRGWGTVARARCVWVRSG
ncbi:MAG: hypothetical protein KatS3mg014_0976 [Actinomycetota bacterium]|nr:MAG: hypothetical protein KatS3mg014_0976 [Actinomycetota bacterium]